MAKRDPERVLELILLTSLTNQILFDSKHAIMLCLTS